MKRIVLLLLLFASPALAKPTIVEFNGFSVRIVVFSNETPPPRSEADQAANLACASNGKTAEYQSREKVAQFRYSYFYACF